MGTRARDHRRSGPLNGLPAHRGWRVLVHHSALNAIGQGLPLVAAVVAVPMLVEALGAERVGLLTLGWAVIGYFSLFDLGLGRALTQEVSARHGQDEHETAAMIRAALGLMVWLGVAGGVVLALGSDWLVTRAMRVSPVLHDETTAAFLLLAASVPVVVLTSGFRGILEAHHRFDLVNAIRAPMGVFTFLAPLALLPYTTSLAAVIALLLAGRVLALLAHVAACARVAPSLRTRQEAPSPPLRPLIRNGGWMTVTNIVSPLMVTADRFLIASVASAAVVAFYTVPFEVASKVLILPLSIAAPLFASFAAIRDPRRQGDLMMRGLVLTATVVFPVILLLILGAPEGMRVWMGAEFASRSGPVLQLLAIGVFFNSIAQAPFALLQANGRSDLTAKLHMVELPLYLAVVVFLVRSAGIEGAAIAWVLRAGVDWLMLTVLAARCVPVARGHGVAWSIVGGTAVASAGAILVPLGSPVARAAYGVAAVLVLGVTLLVSARGGRFAVPTS